MSKSLLDGLNEHYAAQAEAGRSDHLNLSKPWSRPLVIDALAVHPNQVEKARERAKRHGVNVRYLKNGRVEIPDRREYRKLLKMEGCVMLNSYTGC